MVRLEELFTEFRFQLGFSFNSYMVRLEEASAPADTQHKSFQFLYGAIGRTSTMCGYACFRSFNSYMVRLEVSGQFRFFN